MMNFLVVVFRCFLYIADYDCTNEDLRAIEYLKSASETEKLVDIDGAFAHQTHMKCLIEPNTYLLGIVSTGFIHQNGITI